ncbi:hypothetical protein JW859_01675 [bacterium]|nr:hypothetical protein [bacterium]
MRFTWFLIYGLLTALAVPLQALAVPEARHVRLECTVLRLNVNDYSLRHQIRLQVSVSAPTEAELSGIELALLSITDSAGATVTLPPRDVRIQPRQFKAAHASLLFKAIEDSTAPFPQEPSNVPAGFFGSAGPYTLDLTLRGELYSGQVGFGEPLGLAVTQDNQPVSRFCLATEKPFIVTTTPVEFGPVYYKRQDMTNFFFLMASMEQALESQDYHPQLESPRYLFQVRIGDADGGTAHLVDPGRYIDGYQPFLIRSDLTTTPLTFQPEEYLAGQAVIIDFTRYETMPANSVFAADSEHFSSQTEIQERVVYALHVEEPPTPEELGQLPPAADDAD